MNNYTDNDTIMQDNITNPDTSSATVTKNKTRSTTTRKNTTTKTKTSTRGTIKNKNKTTKNKNSSTRSIKKNNSVDDDNNSVNGSSVGVGISSNSESTSSDVPVVKKRGSKSASLIANTTAKPEEIAMAIQHSFQYFNRSIVKSDEECCERINAYFQDCYEQQMIPTVENLSLALGTVRRTLWDWENGVSCSKERSNMIKKAKQILAALDAELVTSGKIPQVVYIFRSKNYYGMTDQQEITVSTSTTNEQDMSADDIAKRYLEDGKRVETEFADEG